jgi:CopG family nickel-responsive transcriptional regulator
MTAKGDNLEIISFSLTNNLTSQLTRIMDEMGYSNRSEVIRDALRAFFEKQKDLDGMEGIIEGVVLILYSHRMEKEVHSILHGNTGIFRSFLHLDFEENCHRCCDVVVFKGNASEVRKAIHTIETTNNVENVKIVLP